MIDRIIINNYKCIKQADFKLNSFKNIIVGNNGVGKSTLIEALSLVLGYGLNKFEITSHIFNIDSIKKYKSEKLLPEILIEVYFDEDFPDIAGTNNSTKEYRSGLYLRVIFDELYRELYSEEVANNAISNIPCEYYKCERYWFSQKPVKQFKMPYTIQIVDTSSLFFSSSSTQYINQLIQKYLGESDATKIRTSLRHLKDSFDKIDDINSVNKKIQQQKKGLTLSVDVTSKIDKRDIICPFIEDIPVSQIGAGEICHLKALLALGDSSSSTHKKIIIIEEPEAHLSHTKMYEMLRDIENHLNADSNQIIITTHNSFVANKLDLSNLIMLDRDNYVLTSNSIKVSNKELFGFFSKICHYPTLRLILCKAVVLVEGPTDEMVVTYYYQKAFKRHPFDDGIELVSVNGTAFKAYVDLMDNFPSKRVAVITDNDGLDDADLFKERGLPSKLPYNVKLFTESNRKLNTLEPSFISANKENLLSLSDFFRVRKIENDTEDKLVSYLKDNKTQWSFRLLENIESCSYNVPQYIIDAIDWVRNEQ